MMQLQLSYRYSFEYIESVIRRTDYGSRHLRMPVNLLDMLLSLVDKQQLLRHIFSRCIDTHFLVILFNAEIPESDLVIFSRSSKDGILSGMPLNGRYSSAVPVEGRKWCIAFTRTKESN